MGARERHLRPSEAKTIIRRIGGERLVRRIEKGENPPINPISPISNKERAELELAIKTLRQEHRCF